MPCSQRSLRRRLTLTRAARTLFPVRVFSTPEMGFFFVRFFTVPIKFRANTAMNHMTGLSVKLCDSDRAVIHEGHVKLNTDASTGEFVSGWFDAGDEETLAKVRRYKIVRANK